MKVRLTKLSDEKFNGNHPNGIYTGRTFEGEEFETLKIGERYHISGLLTSTVQEIIDENTFRTTNSIYKKEIID